MSNFNKVILAGNISTDVELRSTTSNVYVTSFDLAVRRKYTTKDSTPQTDFFTVIAWRGTAEFITNHFAKGKPILVCGSLQTNSWTDQNGNKRKKVVIVADEVSFIGKKDGAAANSESEKEYSDQPSFVDIPEDSDLPF